ncbi:MAG: hypothetical protein Q7T96_15555 [Methylobacter sp.]|nr:hypothetical protein [Methylobacter sp.]
MPINQHQSNMSDLFIQPIGNNQGVFAQDTLILQQPDFVSFTMNYLNSFQYINDQATLENNIH